jgi:hypothetical protein
MAKLPNTTQESIIYVDATPDQDYALRILQAYRANCDVRWSRSGLSESVGEACRIMNEACEKRALILDQAIAILRRAYAEDEAARKQHEAFNAP